MPPPPTHSKQKRLSNHDAEETTTASPSWHDDREEDGNSQLSSCFSSSSLHHDDHDQEPYRRGIVLLSSECSCLRLDGYIDTPSCLAGEGRPITEDLTSENITAFQELSERASLLLKRESCQDFAIEDYFHRSYYERTSTTDSVGGLSDQIEGLTTSSLSSGSIRRSSVPIDKSCRAKMMEWAFRVAEFSFPPPSYLLQQEQLQLQKQEQKSVADGSTNQDTMNDTRTKRRRHSIESLQLITTTFSYIDRLCTKYKVVDRDEYKLLSMVCLHLAAKSSGLFGAHNEKEWYDNSTCPCCDRHENDDNNDDDDGSVTYQGAFSQHCNPAVTTSPSTSSSHDSTQSNNSAFTGRTISSAPNNDNVETSSSPSPQQKPRPPLDLVSLLGLHSLCDGLFTMEQFCEMEYIILHRGLNWRLNSVQAMDWVDLSLDLTMLLLLDGNRSLTSDDCHEIRTAILIQLEYAVEISSFIGYAPSVLGIAAFLNVVEGYSDDDDCGECIVNCVEEVFGLNLGERELQEVRFMMRFQVDEEEYIGILRGG